MRQGPRRRRAVGRGRTTEAAIPWFVIAIVIAIEVFRQVFLQAIITMDGCGQVVFWLSEWERGRSIMQVAGAIIAAFTVWYLVWLFEPGSKAVKAFAALLLLSWAVAYDRQLEMLLPDRPHPLAALSDPLFPVRPEIEWSKDEDDVFDAAIIANPPGLERRLGLDTAPAWKLSPRRRGELFAPDRPERWTYFRLDRDIGLAGRDAPTYGQLEAAKACVAYNDWIAAHAADAGARGYSDAAPLRFADDLGQPDPGVSWRRTAILPPLPPMERIDPEMTLTEASSFPANSALEEGPMPPSRLKL